MEDHIACTPLTGLVEAHRRSVIRVITLKGKSGTEGSVMLEKIVACAAETSTRKRLLEWKAPTTALAIEKLIYLLAHVMAAQLEFDDQSLDLIRAEVARIGNLPSNVRIGSPEGE